MLYFSADNPMLAGEPLYETVKSMFMAGYDRMLAVLDKNRYAYVPFFFRTSRTEISGS